MRVFGKSGLSEFKTHSSKSKGEETKEEKSIDKRDER